MILDFLASSLAVALRAGRSCTREQESRCARDRARGKRTRSDTSALRLTKVAEVVVHRRPVDPSPEERHNHSAVLERVEKTRLHFRYALAMLPCSLRLTQFVTEDPSWLLHKGVEA